MKKTTAIFLCVSLLLASGCTATVKNNKKLIAVSFYPVYIFTLNLVDGIEDVEVSSVAEQQVGCLHDYNVTTKDAKLLDDCDVFIINGAGMELFVEDLYDSVDDLRIIDSSEGAKLLCGEEHSHGEEHGEHSHTHQYNSHIWMSVDNAAVQVENIAQGLCEVFPEYTEKIKENKKIYLAELSALKLEVLEARECIQGNEVLVFHNAYEYLAEDLGFGIHATVQTEDGAEPSSRRLAELCDDVTAHNIKALFVEPGYTGSAGDIISRETGVPVFVINPVLSGDKAKDAYVEIMRENIQIILKAVK